MHFSFLPLNPLNWTDFLVHVQYVFITSFTRRISAVLPQLGWSFSSCRLVLFCHFQGILGSGCSSEYSWNQLHFIFWIIIIIDSCSFIICHFLLRYVMQLRTQLPLTLPLNVKMEDNSLPSTSHPPPSPLHRPHSTYLPSNKTSPHFPEYHHSWHRDHFFALQHSISFEGPLCISCN